MLGGIQLFSVHRRTAMETLMIRDLSREEDLDRNAMTNVHGGIIGAPSYRFHAGMTVQEAVDQFVGYATAIRDSFKGS
jgi:hypothetical protein